MMMIRLDISTFYVVERGAAELSSVGWKVEGGLGVDVDVDGVRMGLDRIGWMEGSFTTTTPTLQCLSNSSNLKPVNLSLILVITLGLFLVKVMRAFDMFRDIFFGRGGLCILIPAPSSPVLLGNVL